jgi:hypothetical protein
MNRLANFKNNPVVRSAIQRDKNIKTTNRNVAIIGGALSTLLIPGGPLAGIGRKAIGQAFKKAGSIGNTKRPDTVGNRLKQSQAILGKSPKDKPFGNRTSMALQDEKRPASTKNPMLGTVMGTSASRKYYRTLTKAIEQGPNKFFSSGRHSKTGVSPNKRYLSKFSGHGALGGTSKGSQSFFNNKVLINTVELSNKEARKVLKNKLRKK